MSISAGWLSSLQAAKKAGLFLVAWIRRLVRMYQLATKLERLDLLVMIICAVLFVKLFSAGMPWAILPLFLALYCYGRWSNHHHAEAFTYRPYTDNRDSYTPMRDLKNGHLYWSEAVKTWRGTIFGYSFFGGDQLILRVWYDGTGRFLEAETSEGRWFGTYEYEGLIEGNVLRIRLTTALEPWVEVRWNHLEVSTGLKCKLDGLWLRVDQGHQLPSNGADSILITFYSSPDEGFIQPQAAALQELPVLMIVAAYRLVKAIYFDPD